MLRVCIMVSSIMMAAAVPVLLLVVIVAVIAAAIIRKVRTYFNTPRRIFWACCFL